MSKKIVFITNSVTLAHPARSILLANMLNSDKYDVVVYCADYYREIFPACKFPMKKVESLSPAEFTRRLRKLRPVFDSKDVQRDLAQNERIIEAEKPDLIIGDFWPSLQISARQHDVPYLNVLNAYWDPRMNLPYPTIPSENLYWVGSRVTRPVLNKILAPLFRYLVHPLVRARRDAGLPAIKASAQDVYGEADFCVYPDMPFLYGEKHAEGARFIGPILWSFGDWSEKLDAFEKSGRYTVYINLGSSGNSGRLSALLEPLVKEDMNVIISTAGSNHELLKSPFCTLENVCIAPYLPSGRVSAMSDIVICNGGTMSSALALLNGAYCIGLCSNMDQLLNMSLIEQRGLGAMFFDAPSSIHKICQLISKRPKLDLTQKYTLERSYATTKPEHEFPAFIEEILGAA